MLSTGFLPFPPFPSSRCSHSTEAEAFHYSGSSMEFQLENPLTDFHSTSTLFATESDHMVSEKYTKSLKHGDFDVNCRRELISLISQLCSKFNRHVSYLAVNYMDRFLSSQQFPQMKPWVSRIIAVSCVSLAAKMQGLDFSLPDLQGDDTNGGSIFDQQSIQRMEVIILGALKWRMRSITPFSFIPFFISLFQLKDTLLRQALKTRALEIIFSAQNCINLLEVKPSIVAAAALISASHELFPLQSSFFQNTISDCSFVNKDNMVQCYETMQQTILEGNQVVDDTVSRSDSPINVLDQHFSSTSDSERTYGTTERAIKKRRNF